MPNYRYKVRDTGGQVTAGVLAAGSLEEAGRLLRAEGRYIVKLSDAGRSPVGQEREAPVARRPPGQVRRNDIITFAHQLAIMLDTGVPITEALECCTEQTPNEAFKHVLREVTAAVQSGGQLSAALSQHAVFPVVMTSLVKASESTGNMGAMLDRVSQYLQKEAATARKIRGAMTYPAMMLVMVLGTTIFLLTFVLPRFAGIYQSKNAALPLPTQLLMTLSDLLIHYWWAWLVAITILAATLFVGGRLPVGRRVKDWLKLHVPVFSNLFRKLYITRGCRTMGTMINAGVPILEMVPIVRAVTCNVYYEQLWDHVDDLLRGGSQLSDGLFGSPLIPRSVAQMVYSGEKAGRLGRVLDRIAEYTEEEFDTAVKQATQYIEPAMILIMGSIIGFVAIALLLPIFSIGQVVSG